MLFDVNIGGQDFEVEAPDEKQLPQIIDTIRREQSAQQKGAVSVSGARPGQFTGEIRKPSTVGEKVRGALPGIGQFGGGLIGATAGGIIAKRPQVGGAVGGTIGRGLGLMGKRGLEQVEREPGKVLTRSILFGPSKGIIEGMSESERKQMGKELFKTAAIESVLAPVGAGVSKFVGNLGKNIAGALLGDRVAERGVERGFKNLLDPKFYKGRLPKELAEKASQFFRRLKDVSGKGVEREIKKKSAVFHNTDDIIEQGKQLLRKNQALSVDDFKTVNTSPSKIKKANEIQKIFNSLSSDEKIGTFELWKKRKEMDKIFYNNTWEDDMGRYLSGLRKITNKPLVETSEEIAESFGRYSFVLDSEEELGKKFLAIKSPNDIFAPRVERFAGQTLSTSTDDQVRLLKALDGILPSEDKVIEELLDAAGAEAIDKPIQQMGLFSRALTGALGGRKSVAGFGKFIQRPSTQAVKRGLGRGLVTGATELLGTENE